MDITLRELKIMNAGQMKEQLREGPVVVKVDGMPTFELRLLKVVLESQSTGVKHREPVSDTPVVHREVTVIPTPIGVQKKEETPEEEAKRERIMSLPVCGSQCEKGARCRKMVFNRWVESKQE